MKEPEYIVLKRKSDEEIAKQDKCNEVETIFLVIVIIGIIVYAIVTSH